MNNINKLLNQLDSLKSELEAKATTGKNTAGIGHANSLIANGKFVKSSLWNPPSSSEENAYIKANGMSAFGKWHLGIDANVDPETKNHWHYIFTSDFKNVDRAGIVAIRQRAGQQKQTDVFDAAGKMLAAIDK